MAATKAAISFGMVHIPIALYTATSEDIVKGFEHAPNQYAIMTDLDFEKAKTEKDKTNGRMGGRQGFPAQNSCQKAKKIEFHHFCQGFESKTLTELTK